MKLIRPRLNDFYGLPFTQEEVSFAIPFLDEDIPLFVDPFRLWSSSSLQDNSLHSVILTSINSIGRLFSQGEKKEAIDIVVELSECSEAGLGVSSTRAGRRISTDKAAELLGIFESIPQISEKGLSHLEVIQLLIPQVAADRISDISCNLIKSFLIDYTIDQARKNNIPLIEQRIKCFNFKSQRIEEEVVELPKSPADSKAVLLIPRRWLRYKNWIAVDDYTRNYFLENIWDNDRDLPSSVEVLDYNRNHYDVVESYIKTKEAEKTGCKNDPLFKQIPVLSANRRLQAILTLKTGNEDRADKIYEENLSSILASAFYPQLDFCTTQSRTDSGVLIRDVIFYNNRSHELLQNIFDLYDSRQLVIEIKNVKELERDHVNQLNRYLSDSLGRFGIIFTRNAPSKKILRNTVDLWAGQRRCILILDDNDLKLICSLYESRQRDPLDVIKKKYVEFMRMCPS